MQLEFFDRLDAYEVRDQITGMSLYEVGAHAKKTVHEFILDAVPDDSKRGELTPAAMVAGWARAFTDDVNWQEIAEHLIDAAGVQTDEK